MMLARRAAAADAAAKDRRNRPPGKAAPSKTAGTKAAGTKPGQAAAKETAEPVAWLSSLSDGYRRALADRKPLVILVAAKWCAACRKLAAEVETAAVQAELARWTPVCLDLDAQADDAERIGRRRRARAADSHAGGQHVAERDGYLAAGRTGASG